MSEERRLWLPNSVKSPQFTLAMSALVVSILLYFHLKGFESWSDIPWRDIRFITEFLVIVIVIPILAYAFGSYYYTCAVITVKPECFQGENEKLFFRTDGKVYSINKKFPQLKVYFSRKGNHSVYLFYDKNGEMVDDPQKANTYEHHIDYVEFKKRITKANQRMPEKKADDKTPRR